MIPILFDADARDFSSRGLGPLTDAIACNVVEERNNTYELDLEYPVDGIHFNDIALNRIIYAIPSPYRTPQPFRIYKISRAMRGAVTVNAQHISYDLSGIAVKPFTGHSVADVLNGIKVNSVNENVFEFSGSSELTRDCTYTTPNSARQILGGMTGSVLDIFGGEYEFDGLNVIWRQNRGANHGVTIRYGKNLLDMTQDVDISGAVTGVIPFWAGTEGGVTVVGDRVNLDGEYSFERIVPLDLSQEFQEAPSKEDLEARAKTYIDANYTAEPEINCDVSFALIEQSEEYKDFKLLEQCDLCDTVTVVYPDLGVNSTAKIVKIDTDVLHNKYNGVTIGSVRANIAQTIAEQQKVVENVPTRKDVSGIVQGALGEITGVNGGAVRLLDTNDDDQPDTLYIADNPDPTLAKQVWRFNYLGWAASSNGYNGPFTLGATLKDGLLADFVTAAKLVAGTITSADSGETFFLDLDSGVLRMKASSLSIGGKTVDDIAGSAADSAINNFVSEKYDPKIADLQKQIDGQIESYFYDEAPTLNNEPAVNWDTETEKQKHEGDLYFNKTTGYAYRFFNENGVWKWQQVQDTDITKALQDAATAKSTADGKSTTFIAEPKTPYYEGDQWYRDNGSVFVCTSTRENGTFSLSDWEKLDNYIDSADAISVVVSQYYLSNSATKLEGGNWQDTQPTWTQGRFIWNRQYVTYGDGTHKYLPSETGVCITGNTGATGASGTSVYTHIRYSANSNGSGFVENPSSTTKYIGIYTGPLQNAPTSNTAYVWSKYMGDNGTNGTNGKDGNGIRSITYYYKATSNQTAPEASTITGTSIPTLSESNKYLWQKEVIDFTASDVADKTTVILLAVYGDKGKDGTSVTIKNTSIKYTASNSGTQTPTSGWGTSVPSVNNGQYLWTQTIVNYSDGKSTTAYAVAYKGTNGTNGKDGAPGDDGIGISSIVAEYYVSDSDTTTTGGTWSTAFPTVQEGKFIWTRQKITYDDSTAHIEYAGQYCLSKTMGDIAQQKVDAQTQMDIFNKLTNNGDVQGIYEQDGQFYINATYVASGVLASQDGETFFLDLDNGILKMKTGLDTYIYTDSEGLHVSEPGSNNEAVITSSGNFEVRIAGETVSSLGNKIQKLGNLTIYETNDGGHAFI